MPEKNWRRPKGENLFPRKCSGQYVGKNRKALCFGRAYSVFPTPHILRDKVKEAMKAGYPPIDIKFTDRIA